MYIDAYVRGIVSVSSYVESVDDKMYGSSIAGMAGCLFMLLLLHTGWLDSSDCHTLSSGHVDWTNTQLTCSIQQCWIHWSKWLLNNRAVNGNMIFRILRNITKTGVVKMHASLYCRLSIKNMPYFHSSYFSWFSTTLECFISVEHISWLFSIKKQGFCVC